MIDSSFLRELFSAPCLERLILLVSLNSVLPREPCRIRVDYISAISSVNARYTLFQLCIVGRPSIVMTSCKGKHALESVDTQQHSSSSSSSSSSCPPTFEVEYYVCTLVSKRRFACSMSSTQPAPRSRLTLPLRCHPLVAIRRVVRGVSRINPR